MDDTNDNNDNVEIPNMMSDEVPSYIDTTTKEGVYLSTAYLVRNYSDSHPIKKSMVQLLEATPLPVKKEALRILEKRYSLANKSGDKKTISEISDIVDNVIAVPSKKRVEGQSKRKGYDLELDVIRMHLSDEVMYSDPVLSKDYNDLNACLTIHKAFTKFVRNSRSRDDAGEASRDSSILYIESFTLNQRRKYFSMIDVSRWGLIRDMHLFDPESRLGVSGIVHDISDLSHGYKKPFPMDLKKFDELAKIFYFNFISEDEMERGGLDKNPSDDVKEVLKGFLFVEDSSSMLPRYGTPRNN